MKKNGLTLLELMLSIGILAIMAGFLIPVFGNFRNATELNASSTDVVFLLRRAQSFSKSNINSIQWGVYFNQTNSSYELRTYSPTQTVEQIFLPKLLEFETFGGSGNTTTEIIFQQRSGRRVVPTSTTITVRLKSIVSQSKQITASQVV